MNSEQQNEAIRAFYRIRDAYNNLTLARIDRRLEHKAAMLIDASWRGCFYPDEVKSILELDGIIKELTQ